MVVAFISGLAIELRFKLLDEKSNVYGYFKTFFLGPKLTSYEIMTISIFFTFIVALLVYSTMYIIFKYGGGMMV